MCSVATHKKSWLNTRILKTEAEGTLGMMASHARHQVSQRPQWWTSCNARLASAFLPLTRLSVSDWTCAVHTWNAGRQIPSAVCLWWVGHSGNWVEGDWRELLTGLFNSGLRILNLWKVWTAHASWSDWNDVVHNVLGCLHTGSKILLVYVYILNHIYIYIYGSEYGLLFRHTVQAQDMWLWGQGHESRWQL